jgi:hypothetical protein
MRRRTLGVTVALAATAVGVGLLRRWTRLPSLLPASTRAASSSTASTSAPSSTPSSISSSPSLAADSYATDVTAHFTDVWNGCVDGFIDVPGAATDLVFFVPATDDDADTADDDDAARASNVAAVDAPMYPLLFKEHHVYCLTAWNPMAVKIDVSMQCERSFRQCDVIPVSIHCAFL